MKKTQLQLLRSLEITTWHRQPDPAVGENTSIPLLIIAPGISDFMMHQVLFKRILDALSLPEGSWRVIHEPGHFHDAGDAESVWVIGDAGELEDSLPADTIYTPLLGVVDGDRGTKKRLWEQLKGVTPHVSR